LQLLLFHDMATIFVETSVEDSGTEWGITELKEAGDQRVAAP